MEEEYILKYTGEETDALLKHTESLKDQTTAEDGETVQVYDESGIPHKVAKTELLNKAILATTSIQDISKFIAINEAGDAVGIMTLEQITEVFRKEFAKFPSSPETSAVVAVNKEGDALGLMSNEKLAEVVGALLNPLLPQRTLTSSDNLNNITPGYYNYYEEAGFPVNLPDGTCSRGYIISFPNIGGNQVQLIFDWGYDRVLARGCNSTTNWRGWVTLNN